MKRLLKTLAKLAKKLFSKKGMLVVTSTISVLLVFSDFQGEFLKYEVMLRGMGFIWGVFSFALFVLIWDDNKQKQKTEIHSRRSIKVPLVF